MSQLELKPCPFCGGEAHVVADIYNKCYIVKCNSCHSRTPRAYYNRRKSFVKGGLGFCKCETDDDARAFVIETWNRRTK